MDPIYAHLVPVFVAEAEGRLADWQGALAELRRGVETRKATERLHRAVHSITGNAAMLGIPALAALARDVERVTHALQTHPGSADVATCQALDRACDTVAGMVALVGAGGHPLSELELSERLARLAERLRSDANAEEM